MSDKNLSGADPSAQSQPNTGEARGEGWQNQSLGQVGSTPRAASSPFPIEVDDLHLNADGTIDVLRGDDVFDATDDPSSTDAFSYYLDSEDCPSEDRPHIAAALLRNDARTKSAFRMSKEGRAQLEAIASEGGYEPCVSCRTPVDTEDRPLDREGQAQCAACERNDAIAAGIPAAVVDGKAKLTDYFSRDYIDSQKGGGS